MFEVIALIAVMLAVAIAIVLILTATKPNTFSVPRATAIKAPPEKIFPLINDFHRWGSWSPYESKDPAPFTSKLMQVFMRIDSIVGKDLEVGLANLKFLAEK